VLIEKVLEAAEPFLKDRVIADAVVGISLLAVQLDDGAVGLAYVLRDSLPSGCSIFPYVQDLIGRPAREVAAWAATGPEDLARGLGIAVLNAASRAQDLKDEDDPGLSFGVRARPGDTVGLVGYIPPIARAFEGRAGRVIVFDQGLYAKEGARNGVLPTEEQPRLLPACDIVILSGSTVVNRSIDGLLALCPRAREIILVGASTPLFPAAYADTRVSVLAGSWWSPDGKADLFRRISLAGGIAHVQRYAQKKAVRLR